MLATPKLVRGTGNYPVYSCLRDRCISLLCQPRMVPEDGLEPSISRLSSECFKPAKLLRQNVGPQISPLQRLIQLQHCWIHQPNLVPDDGVEPPFTGCRPVVITVLLIRQNLVRPGWIEHPHLQVMSLLLSH